MQQVLIVDDEEAMRAGLEQSFTRHGWKARSAAGVNEALAEFRSSPATLVISDMRMPDGDGLAVMEGVRECVPNTPVIFLTAYGSVPDAVQAIKGGACDYFQKPVAFDDLEACAKRLLPASSFATGARVHAGIGTSPVFVSLVARAHQIAKSDFDVLIEAESGVGKELLAREIHNASSRCSGPFVAVNCSAFPEQLLESELFGHVRGAFTGASGHKPGKFQLANGGTILLDEIGELPRALQPKLLRVLQERQLDRLGDTRSVAVDVRVIATTNRSLRAQVAVGEFRADLYYRLNVVPLTIPPLRDRREDILLLANHFLRKHESRDRSGTYRFSPELEAQLQSHDWPGNIRELENFIRRMIALSPGPTLQADKTQQFNNAQDSPSPAHSNPGSLQEMERTLVESTLRQTGGNRTRAAELLGVSLRTVRNKIREYGLPARGAL
jgi:DNA-binding NtrC family response regulator